MEVLQGGIPIVGMEALLQSSIIILDHLIMLADGDRRRKDLVHGQINLIVYQTQCTYR